MCVDGASSAPVTLTSNTEREITMHRFVITVAGLALASSALAAPRDIQFRTANLDAGILELHNFGSTSEDLTGWRFCSHDEDVVRRYSATGGLNGVSIAPGESLYVHFNNDADAANEINISDIGGNFAGISSTAYAIQIYFAPVSFGNGNTMADNIQWTADGSADLVADERTDEAISGGIWGALDDFIALDGGAFVRLTNLTGAELNNSSDYRVAGAIQDCNMNGRDDVFEILDGGTVPCGGVAGCVGDFDDSGTVDSGDLAALLAAWGPCP